MIEIIPARAEMAYDLKLQRAQTLFGVNPTPEMLAHAIHNGLGYAAIREGELIAMAGVREIWQGRAVAWGLLSEGIGASMVPITRTILRYFQVTPYRRIEAEVAGTHEEGKRWVELLGFKREGTMRAYWNGHDFDLYARVRD